MQYVVRKEGRISFVTRTFRIGSSSLKSRLVFAKITFLSEDTPEIVNTGVISSSEF